MPKVDDARKEQVRNQLIDAAIEVLLAHGPTGVTSRRILERAGLSAGALYHYFASLDELYEAMARRFTAHDSLYDRAPGGTSEDIDGSASAASLADMHVAVMDDLFGHGDAVLLSQLRSAADTNGGVRAALQEYDRTTVARAGEFNRASQDDRLFRSDVDVEALAEVVGAFFEGFTTKSRATGFATSRQRVLALFLEMVCERILDPDHPDAATLRKRLEEISQR